MFLFFFSVEQTAVSVPLTPEKADSLTSTMQPHYFHSGLKLKRQLDNTFSDSALVINIKTMLMILRAFFSSPKPCLSTLDFTTSVVLQQEKGGCSAVLHYAPHCCNLLLLLALQCCRVESPHCSKVSNTAQPSLQKSSLQWMVSQNTLCIKELYSGRSSTAQH